MSVAWVGVGVAAYGAYNQSQAAGSAAQGQSDAAAASNALQQYMFDRNVELQMPTINAGNTARDRLLYGLGLASTPTTSTGQQPLTYDQLRQQLVGSYTRTANGSQPALPPGVTQEQWNAIYGPGGVDPASQGQVYRPRDVGENTVWEWVPNGQTQTSSTIDEAGLDAEIRRRLAQQDADQQAAQERARSDPFYGSLAQQFTFDKYTPGTFSYTGEDLYKDPSYQFRLEQGQKALDRSGAAAGRFLSGRQLQAASDYNQGAASQEFQNAYGRALGTFNTNEGNRFNAFTTNENNRFNAYQANFTNTINPLLSLAGSGQVGAQFLGNAGTAYAGNVGNNLQGAANASGAAQIAGANAAAGGLSNAVTGYQQNQLLQNLLRNNRGVNNNPGSGYSGTFTPSPMGETYA